MSDREQQLFRQKLGAAGYSLTKARQAVFQALHASEPQSMAEVVQKVTGKLDRASVYRSVALFEALGIAHRVHLGWKYKLELSDDFLAHHHHLSCTRCGKVVDIHDDTLVEEFIRKVSRRLDFTPQRHQLEIEGLCAACQRLAATPLPA